MVQLLILFQYVLIIPLEYTHLTLPVYIGRLLLCLSHLLKISEIRILSLKLLSTYLYL